MTPEQIEEMGNMRGEAAWGGFGSEFCPRPAGGGVGVRAETMLVFRTAAEISSEGPTEVEWVARPWVALGAITEVDGQVKSAGKTTWLTYMSRSIMDGS